MPDTRIATDGRLMLELEGVACGFPITVEGGEPFATAVLEPVGPDQVVRKHPGPLAFAPIRLAFDAGMRTPFYQWLASWLKGERPVKSGAVVFLDARFVELSRMTFTRALISRLAFPALDAASRERASFNVSLQPETVRTSTASAGTQRPGPGAPGPLMASNFRLKIDGLPTARVHKIDALAVEQPRVPNALADAVLLQPLQIPNLTFSLPQGDAKQFADWFEDFVVNGLSSPQSERSGSLELLAPNLQTVLLSFALSHLGILRVHRQQPGGGDALARSEVELYCEQIGFVPVPGVAGPAI